jgi:hypothetical protein
MLYTSIEKVKQHLISVFPIQERVIDQMVVLSGIDFATFFGGAIDGSTLVVKSVQSNDLNIAGITLGISATALPDSLLIRGTVVVTLDSSLSTIYVENKDYIIDYSAGTISIKSGGILTSGQQIYVLYENYVRYDDGSDFVASAFDGRIRRTANSGMASGETVYLDYSPIINSYNDVMFQNAVDEANALIEKTIDPDQQFGLEPLLQIAATYRAVETVSRASAARELSSQRGEHNVALAWLKLADEYSRRADELIAAFRPPVVGPSAPTAS